MDGALPTFLLCDFTTWKRSTSYLYDLKVPTETVVIQIIYKKYGNSTARFIKITNQMHQYPKSTFVTKPHISGILCAHRHGLSTVHMATGTLCAGYVTASQQSQVGTQESQSDSVRKQSHNLHEAFQLPCVQWITHDDGHRGCPKHVGFCDKSIFWILMHLAGYFYTTYHDAQSP